MDHSFYAPSFRLKQLAWSGYGFGHTSRREPGDVRGTVVGKRGRFRGLMTTKRGDALRKIQKGDPCLSTSGRTCTRPAGESPPDIQTTRHSPSRTALTGPPFLAASSTGSTW